MVTIMMSALTVVFGSLVAWWVTHNITAPLAEAVELARRVAKGDLSSDIVVQSTDETGQLMQALKDMNASLMRIVGEVRRDSESISDASTNRLICTVGGWQPHDQLMFASSWKR